MERVEAMDNDLRTASKRFWTTIRRLRRGKECSVDTVYGGNSVLLTSTQEVVNRWKEYFEDLLKLTKALSGEKAGPVDSGAGSLIFGTKVARSPGVNEVCPEFLKALDVVGLLWLTRLCNITWISGAVPLDWQTRVVVPFCKKEDRRMYPSF